METMQLKVTLGPATVWSLVTAISGFAVLANSAILSLPIAFWGILLFNSGLAVASGYHRRIVFNRVWAVVGFAMSILYICLLHADLLGEENLGHAFSFIAAVSTGWSYMFSTPLTDGR